MWVVLAMMAVCSGLVTACSIVGALDGGGDCLGMNVGLCQGGRFWVPQCFLGDAKAQLYYMQSPGHCIRPSLPTLPTPAPPPPCRAEPCELGQKLLGWKFGMEVLV